LIRGAASLVVLRGHRGHQSCRDPVRPLIVPSTLAGTMPRLRYLSIAYAGISVCQLS
jgi:hypothetical protein